MFAAPAHPFLGLHDTDLIAIGGVARSWRPSSLLPLRFIRRLRLENKSRPHSLLTTPFEKQRERKFSRSSSADCSLPDERQSFTYRISNQGTGPALDIEHGIIVDGGGEICSPRVRSLRVEENHRITVPVPSGTHIVSSFARFSNVFGERFETINPVDRDIPATFCRVRDTE